MLRTNRRGITGALCLAVLAALAVPMAGSAALDEETMQGVGAAYFNTDTLSITVSGELVQSLRVETVYGPAVQTLSRNVCATIAVNATGEFEQGCVEGTVLIDPTLSIGIIEASIMPEGTGSTLTVAVSIQGTGIPTLEDVRPPDYVQYSREGNASGTVTSDKLGGVTEAQSDYAIMNGWVALRDLTPS